MNEDTNESLPVRETGYLGGRNPIITRDLSDDRLLQVSEENVNLKRHLRKQEDRIRQLATKLVRVIGDRSKRSKRDDIVIEDQKSRIGELEAQVNHLRSKLAVARQQLGSYTKLVPGVPKHSRPKSSRSSTGTPTGKVIVPDQVTRLLLDAKGENHALKDQVKHLHERWAKTNQELTNLKEQLKLKDVEHHDEMLVVKSQTQSEVEVKQKKIAENIQLIRLQRDAKRTASWLATYETQCRSLEANLNAATENVSQLELQLSTAQEELRNEQSKSLNLLKQVEEASSFGNQVKEANAQISALQDENKILKEANETLLSKSLQNCSRVQEIDTKEADLNLRNEKLESTLKTELKGKSELISALTQEKAKCISLEQALQNLEKKYNTISAEITSASEELAKAKNNSVKPQAPEIVVEKEFVTRPCENCPVREAELNQLQIQICQIKAEIGKTKELLKTQISINKEYQEEVEALTSQLTSLEVLHQKERTELMEIFTEKTNKMAELEQSLEELRQRRSNVPAQAFISFENYQVQNAESSENSPGDAQVETPIDEESTDLPKVPSETPNGNGRLVPFTATTVESEAKEQDVNKEEVDKCPKLSVFIKQFVPSLRNQEIVSGLFITWEHENIPRQYSPIVSDGVFNSESTHPLSATFQLRKLLVQLHQAIGESDARTLALGEIDIPSSQSEIALREMENGAEFGKLLYTCALSNFEFTAEANNNKTEIHHENKPPIPTPRKLKHVVESRVEQPQQLPLRQLESVEMNSEISERELQAQYQPAPIVEISSISHLQKKTTRKSILRRETKPSSPKCGKRRVRVNDNIQERKFDSDSEGQIHEQEPGQAVSQLSIGQALSRPQDSQDTTPSEVLNELSLEQESSSNEITLMDSEVSEKRRARRISKRPIITDESDDISTTLSVEESESETSKNISEIETTTMSEHQWSRSECEFIIEISYAKFHPNSGVQHDSNIKKFYVEYQFLNYSAEELETEVALPKPGPGRKAVFDFRKVFMIDTKEKRRLLKDMLETNTSLRFTLVTEPSDNDTIDCEDIGYAYVSLTGILNSGNDIIKKEIPVYDSENSNSEIGILCISTIAFKTLDSL